MFYLLLCPFCKRIQVYNYSGGTKRARKACVNTACKKKFDIKPSRIIKDFDNPKECREALLKISRYQNDHTPRGTLEKIIEKFRKCLFEQVSEREEIFEKELGHRAYPHDQNDHLTLHELVKFHLEVDRLHFTFTLPVVVYDRLTDNLSLSTPSFPADSAYEPHLLKRSYGELRIYPSGLIDCYIDSSNTLNLAELEGMIVFLKKISGHQGHLAILVHEREFTLSIADEEELAKQILEAMDSDVAYLFNDPITMKLYNRKTGRLAIEAYGMGELTREIRMLKAGKIKPPDVCIFTEPSSTDKQQVQVLQQQIESLNSKLDHVIDNLVLLTDSQNTLMLTNQDMKAEIELTRETQREGNQTTHTLLHELNKRFDRIHESNYEQKCRTILSYLSEKPLSLKELAEKLDQKQQGLNYYLETLVEQKRIEIIEQGRRTGKRGRPANLIKIKEGGESG